MHSSLASVWLWKLNVGGSLKARFLQCGDQVSRISFDFLEWRSMGPQKLATIIGHKYSIFKPSKKNKGVFLIIKIRQIIRSKKNFKNFNFLGSWISKIVFILVEKFKFSQYYSTKSLKFLQENIIRFLNFKNFII